MRLTLRTMLCYLDDVLEPADARELAAKIEESEYATNVVHRIRTSMRRLRLGAPAVSGQGMGFDPNTVADYLDNTLAPEQVADFERVCLDTESEAQLAEVAACHQILTLVLGEPAEVPPPMRHRVYGLGQLNEQQLAAASIEHSEPLAPPVAPDAVASSNGASAHHRVDPPVAGTTTALADADADKPTPKERQKPEIPEYLRQGGNQRAWPMALVVLLLVILLGGIAVTLWPPGGMQQANNDQAENNAVTNGEDDNEGGQPIAPAPRRGTDDAAPEPAPANENGGNAGANNRAITNSPVANGSVGAGNGTGGNGNATPSVEPASVDEPTVSRDDLVPPAADGAEPGTIPADGTPDDGIPDDTAIARVEPKIGEDPTTGTVPEPVLPPVDKVTAHFISTSQVMVGWDNEAAVWMRLPPRAQLKPGAQIRSLPTYRPQLLLMNDIQFTFADEGIATIGNPVDDLPFIEMQSGRAVIATVGKADRSLILDADGRTFMITLVNAEAEVAISVKPFHLPGENPETELPHVQITAIVTAGQVQFLENGADPVMLDAGQQISMLDEGLARVQTTESVPKWVKNNDISEIDRLASATLEPMLEEDRPMEISLAERIEHPRVEVRSLAARSLASIDKFDALIDTFNDETLKSYWSDHFDVLQSALARGPATATKVREAVERTKGTDAERIYRLLQGYSAEQLKAGADKTLVEYLRHESLDVRVLAINNLRRITSRTFLYHPHVPETRRSTPMREWEQAAKEGTIVYLNPPAELPKRKPSS